MIYSLSGKIIKKTLNAVVVSCGGVGYYVQCPTSVAGALPGVGREATLYTVMSVTENDISLYGFATEEQQSCFELLTAVSGVGPKVGLAILSVMEPGRVYIRNQKAGAEIGIGEGIFHRRGVPRGHRPAEDRPHAEAVPPPLRKDQAVSTLRHFGK